MENHLFLSPPVDESGRKVICGRSKVPYAVRGLSHEPGLRGRDARVGEREDQYALARRVVQALPGGLDLDQLPQAVLAKVTDGELVVCFGRVRSELAVEARPGEPHRTLQREGAVGDPEVEIEAQGRAFEGLEDVYVERHGGGG